MAALSVDYDDLLTVSQLRADALEAHDLTLTQSAGSPDDEDDWNRAVLAIKEATSLIENWASRRFIVQSYKFELYPDRWNPDDDFDRYWLWAPEHPVVEIGDSDSDLTLRQEDHDQTQLLLSYDADNDRDDEKTVDPVYAGYRRPDQVVGSVQSASGNEVDLTDQDGLSGLSVTPNVLPYIVRKVASDIAMNMIHEATEGNIGGGEITRQIRGEMITIRQPTSAFIDQKLARLRRYKHEFSHGS